MIDLHCHVLPLIDDGPASIEGSVALARAAAADGTEILVATPHVSSRYPNEPDAIARGVRELNERLAAEQVAVEIRAGAELAMSRLLELDAREISRFGLGGGEWLLVECPLGSEAPGLEILVLDLQRRGHRVLLAHPERCPALRRDWGLLESLVRVGALTSVTASALSGRFGTAARDFAWRLAREEMLHNVVSDAHDDVRRPPQLGTALRATELAPLRDWLTEAVPAAILDGGDIPPRPPVALPVAGRRMPWRRQRR